MLLPPHLEDLRKSGLTDETLASLGFYSGTAEQVASVLGFSAGPGLIIPYPQHRSGPPFARVKPDQPPVIDGKPAKYLSPKGRSLQVYIPPRSWQALQEANTRVIVTEGEKKAAKADQEGLTTIALGGIWAFRDREHLFLPDLDALTWGERPVTLVPDSDVAINDQVRDPVWELGWQLLQRGGFSSVVVLPPGPDGSKQGLDDYLVAQGASALEDLISTSEILETWACSLVAAMPEVRKPEGLRWLARRLKALDTARRELTVNVQAKRLGLTISALRRLIQGDQAWAPAPPKAEREEAEQEKARLQAEASAKQRASAQEMVELEARARALLQDPAVLFRLGGVLGRLGLAGEAANSRIVYLTITSRIQDYPISLTVKGESSAGKSYLVGRVLELFPASAYLALTGMSRQALVYSQESVAHRAVIIFERPGMEAADYNIRTLQSEGKIVFETVERDPATNEQRTVRKEKQGPTNFIFTTAAPQIHQETETRHWSIFVDESPTQTAAIKIRVAEQYTDVTPVSREELAVWRKAQELLCPTRVVVPYARWLAQHTPDSPLRMRRDFTRLLALIETITVLCQEQREVRERGGTRALTARLEDYFVARELLGDNFAAEVHGRNAKVAQIVNTVLDIYTKKMEAAVAEPVVSVGEVAAALGRGQSTVRRWIRPALDSGWVEEAIPAAGRKAAAYVPGKPMPDPSPLPSVEEIAEAFPDLARGFRAVHPLTGEAFEMEANGEPVAEQIAHGAPA